ncbi:Bestrophin, RFP-TM, chloride channel-domain-containing protein [Crassisporium funariophilum]|nr:Bestrophin, RFP-TM, chloride channel-domain-containing protein [Crassisporium funariophilum]
MSTNTLKTKRSMTGNHPLLPASRPGSTYEPIPRVPTYSLITWTFGRGSVIWRIWPAVLLHTLFAFVVVTISMRKIVDLQIPSVMLTVLGVVIGFVISYRAISGYERYWMGRTCWSDVIRNARTLGRLFWFHVPPRISVKTAEEVKTGQLQRSVQELNKVMAEKRMAVDLIEGFAVALKHHIRGELGIYYEDLYHLVRPMHDHDHSADDKHTQEVMTTALPSPRRGQRITTQTVIAQTVPEDSYAHVPTAPPTDTDPEIPPINAYGTFDAAKLSSGSRATSRHLLKRSASQASGLSTVSTQSQHQPLLPGSQPPVDDNVMDKVSGDLIPFAGIISMLRRQFSPQTPAVLPPGNRETSGGNSQGPPLRQWQGPIHPGLHSKHRPKVAGGGENLPLEILRCLSEWCSVLEDRATVPGTSLGAMIATLAAFEESLSALERILTTPLPFVYSVHIRHTVWVYLFFLPFQLVSQFGYYTIPGVAIAAFIYLGFLAAGEEIEQPFGYDDNDLDLDLFCHHIIHADIKHLKTSPCLNAYFGPELKSPARPVPRRSLTLTEISGLEEYEGQASGVSGHLQWT